MGSCLSRENEVGSASVSDVLKDFLPRLAECFVGIDFVCLLTGGGDVLGTSHSGYFEPLVEDVGATVAALQMSAIHFSRVLGQSRVLRPVVHIAGEVHLFSCYELAAGNMLAFYSSLPGASVPDTRATDLAMETILRDLECALSS